MGKLIDLTSHLSSRNNNSKQEMTQPASVVDIAEPRKQVLNQERRDLRRTILTEFVGAFVVVPQRGLLKVSLYDISVKGIAFELETNQGRFDVGEKIAMRIYLNHKTFFEFVIHIKWFEDQSEFGLIRHGAGYVRNTTNDVALHHFVKFIEAVSVNLKVDEGDLLISGGT